MTRPLSLPRHPALRVAEVDGKGRGLFAGAPIKAGEVLEAAPVILIRAGEEPALGQALYDYPFKWDDPPYAEAIALGLVSMCNHSSDPNCNVDLLIRQRLVCLTAAFDIEAGEELTFDYGVAPWWDASR